MSKEFIEDIIEMLNRPRVLSVKICPKDNNRYYIKQLSKHFIVATNSWNNTMKLTLPNKK